MSTKKIAINPEFFKLTNVSSKKKVKKEKPSPDLVKNDLKKQLISKVNKHRNKIQKDKLINESKAEIKEIPDNIDQSLEYLNSLAKKKVEKKRKKKERKNKTFKITDTDTTPIEGQPPYSNLKNSRRPTYSQWKKTFKNRDNVDKEQLPSKSNISFGEGDEITTDVKIFEDSFDERQNKLNTLKITLGSDNEEREKKKVKRKHKTIRRKITLGKHKNRVGVLIKNKKTRKNIKSEIDVLKKKSINKIKKYLRKHNFIKIGSSAPNDILKDMFIDVYTSGDIYNTSADILLHNYIGNN
jgi:hypothetical protein